jgi:RimJ/RimL family protein N-acetyltransferase
VLIELTYTRRFEQIETPFPLINSVLSGIQDGIVIGDNVDEKPLFVIHKSGFSYLMNKSEDIYLPILEFLIKSEKIPQYFHLYDCDSSFLSLCKNQRDKLNLKARKRIQMRISENRRTELNISYPIKYAIKKITLQNFESLSRFKLELEKKFWRSMEDFTKHGFGFYVFDESDLPVSICYTACVVKRIAEIDVLTLPGFQKMGLAKSVVSRFVGHCIENEIVANWDCFIENLSSKRTAESLGFVEVNKYTLLSIFNKNKHYESR